MSNARLKRKRKAREKRQGKAAGQLGRRNKKRLRAPVKKGKYTALDFLRARRFGRGPLMDEIRRAMKKQSKKG